MSRFTGSSDQQRLCSLLRQIRVEAGLKQAELARLLGESQSFVSKYEMGERRLDFLELAHICRTLGLSLKDFVGRFDACNETKSSISKTTKAFLGKRPKH